MVKRLIYLFFTLPIKTKREASYDVIFSFLIHISFYVQVCSEIDVLNAEMQSSLDKLGIMKCTERNEIHGMFLGFLDVYVN
jgi:hypothetical protein